MLRALGERRAQLLRLALVLEVGWLAPAAEQRALVVLERHLARLLVQFEQHGLRLIALAHRRNDAGERLRANGSDVRPRCVECSRTRPFDGAQRAVERCASWLLGGAEPVVL